MRNALPIAGCCVALIAALYWYFNAAEPPRHNPQHSSVEPGASHRAEPADNPFAADQAAMPDLAPAEQPEPAQAPLSPDPKIDREPIEPAPIESNDLRAYEIAADGQSWNEAQYQYELERLRNDPQLLEALLLEFQNENDPTRRRRLASLLGNFDSPALLATLEAMIAGDTESRASAFDVLGRIQPRSSPARQLAIDQLQRSSDPSIQIGAMNALTTVASATTSSERQTVQQAATELASSSDSAVRQRAVATLGNWATNDSATEVLMQGLGDSDPAVRRSSAYAFIDYDYTTPNAISALLARAEDDSEQRRVRRAATLVLRSMPLTESQRARLNVAADAMER